MIIHVVQTGETCQTIADYYGISVTKLILDNGIDKPDHLVVGQSMVIAYPELTYTVKEGDTLTDIANVNQISLMQLLRNNPFLSEREYIYPGETLVIQYNTKGKVTTHGNTVPYINKDTLIKTLPYLTYLSVLNYTATKDGEIISYYDESEIIQITKAYSVIPLMLLTTLTLQGEANLQITYEVLLSKAFQNKQIEGILSIIKSKGYAGVNISFQSISILNLKLYEEYLAHISSSLNAEGYLVFVTINPQVLSPNKEVSFEQVDYSSMDRLVQNIIFMSYEWAANINPPAPISSISKMDIFINYIKQYILPDKIILGLATLAYDWELPYSFGLSSVNSLTLERAIDLARNVGAVIHFDEISQTPYFTYTVTSGDSEISHIVWFIDARSINALMDLVLKYNLQGTSIWNITIFNPQLWLIINSQFEILKIEP